MNSIFKSIYIVIFPLLALVALIDSIGFMYYSGVTIQHLAHFSTAICIVFYFTKVFVKPVPRADSVLQTYTFIIFLGCLLSLLAITLQEDEPIRIVCVTYNLLLTIGWIVFLLWYSFFQGRNVRNNAILKKGSLLPQLTFEDISRNVVTSKQFAGTPSIFVFYRGNWCPFCIAQIKEMVSHQKELVKRNINTIFISSQPKRFSESLMKKYPLDFQFLVDVDGKTAKELDIFDAHGLPFGLQLFGFGSHTILPTIIITDAEERIIYTNQAENYRERPEPTTLLKVIDEHL